MGASLWKSVKILLSEQSILLICVHFHVFLRLILITFGLCFLPRKNTEKFFLKITSSEETSMASKSLINFVGFFYTFVFVTICNEKSAKSTDFASEFGKQKWWPNERSEKVSISTYKKSHRFFTRKIMILLIKRI